MPSTLSRDLDALADWRRALDRRIEPLARLLADQDLLDADAAAHVSTLRQRLGHDRLVLAFVAEFSRGKSELINALFFADTGRRVLPATPGRTTMCPVELAWDPREPAGLALLPIASRSGGQPVSVLRGQPELWRHEPLALGNAAELARVLQEVTRTTRVPLAEARALGFWDDDHPDDNPPRDAHDQVEVPAWRHALINYPHPLLERGLVVIDTPGLNAIGAEPELTLSLLPSAHATVFVLAADAGVTRSDLAIWRDHLSDRALERFVVLNKIDALVDPLLGAEQIAAQVAQQCLQVAATLAVPRERVYPLSARQALAARVHADAPALAASGLPALEHALATQLLPQRGALIGRMVEDGTQALRQQVQRRLADRRRQVTEQLLDLRELRGKSSARVQMMSGRFERDAASFEECLPRLAALRAVLARLMRELLRSLSSERVRDEITRLQGEAQASVFRLGAAKSFARLGVNLRGHLDAAEATLDEIDQMLAASQRELNAKFGFALAMAHKPGLDSYRRELQRIEAGHGRYFGLTRIWRLSQSAFLAQFLQALQSRLRAVFDSAALEVAHWSNSALAQMESQLRERRGSLQHRREAFARIRAAEGGLEQRIAEVDAQHDHWRRLGERVDRDIEALRLLAASAPHLGAAETAPRLALVRPLPARTSRGAA